MTIPDSLEASIAVAAVVFAEIKSTFAVRDFVQFVQMAGVSLSEECAGETLDGLVTRGALREIGPGVYAAAQANTKSVSMEHPIWSDEAAQ